MLTYLITMSIGCIVVKNSKDTGYYLRTRVPVIRLIYCLPETIKGMDEDFLIIREIEMMGYTVPCKIGN